MSDIRQSFIFGNLAQSYSYILLLSAWRSIYDVDMDWWPGLLLTIDGDSQRKISDAGTDPLLARVINSPPLRIFPLGKYGVLRKTRHPGGLGFHPVPN